MANAARGQYKVEFERSVLKALKKLDRVTSNRILLEIRALATEPRPRGAVKLAGSQKDWRIRVGDYRVVYSVEDERLLVLVIRVGHRREVYQ